MDAPCPTCGFRTVPEAFYGSYNICDVCGWEDDGVQLANPACGGGANRESLIEAQRAALARHPLSQQEVDGYHRDQSWRPLNTNEIDAAEAEREEKYWRNKAVFDLSDAYWLKTA